MRLVDSATRVAEEWMRQWPSDALPEVVIEGCLFTPPDGNAYVLVEFIRFVGTRNLNLCSGNTRDPANHLSVRSSITLSTKCSRCVLTLIKRATSRDWYR